MTLQLRFLSAQSSLTRQTRLPHRSRCGIAMDHPVIEKEAGELIVRCIECNANNVLRLAIINPKAVLTLEVTGWME